MRFRLYIASSLDGLIADADGGVGWLDAYHGDDDYGYSEFLTQIGTTAMGRSTYDQVRGFGEWPYAGLESYVVSSRPLDDPPDAVTAWNRPLRELVERLRTEECDCWILGGSRLLRGFAELDAVDEYEVFVMPVVLGKGIPLFAEGYPAQQLELIDVHHYENGVVRKLLRPIGRY